MNRPQIVHTEDSYSVVKTVLKWLTLVVAWMLLVMLVTARVALGQGYDGGAAALEAVEVDGAVVMVQQPKGAETIGPIEAVDAGIGQVSVAPAPSVGTLIKDLPADLDSPDAYLAFGRLLLRAINDRDWKFLAGLLLTIFMLLVRKGVAWAEAHTKEGGWAERITVFALSEHGGRLMLFGSAALTGLSATLLAHKEITLGLIWQILTAAALGSAGWHELLKPYVIPFLTWLKNKVFPPAPASPTPNGRTSIGVLLILVLLAAGARAIDSAGTYGNVTLAALTAKALTTTNILNARKIYMVANCDSVAIYCGFDSSVTAANGWPVEKVNADGTCGKATFEIGTGAALWCYSTPGTAANAVRYVQTR